MASDSIWKALADPTRRMLLGSLRDGPLTTGALADRAPHSRIATIKHLGVLEDCGLITVERRGRERWNYLNGALLRSATDQWLTPFQRLWGDRLGDLRKFVEEDSHLNSSHGGLPLDIRQVIELAAAPQQVFDALTIGIDRWWGERFRQTGSGSRLSLQPELGADMIETDDHGHSAIWARVEEIIRPGKLYLSGRFAMDGAVAGRIHYDIADSDDGGSILTLRHQAVGAIDPGTVDRFDNGWRVLLDQMLRTHLEGGA